MSTSYLKSFTNWHIMRWTAVCLCQGPYNLVSRDTHTACLDTGAAISSGTLNHIVIDMTVCLGASRKELVRLTLYGHFIDARGGVHLCTFWWVTPSMLRPHILAWSVHNFHTSSPVSLPTWSHQYVLNMTHWQWLLLKHHHTIEQPHPPHCRTALSSPDAFMSAIFRQWVRTKTKATPLLFLNFLHQAVHMYFMGLKKLRPCMTRSFWMPTPLVT